MSINVPNSTNNQITESNLQLSQEEETSKESTTPSEDIISKISKTYEYNVDWNYFELSDSDIKKHGDLFVHHVFKADRYADLPLLVVCPPFPNRHPANENGHKAVIPVFKSQMLSFVPNYFKIFFEKKNFAEKNHKDGELYQITIPGLEKPWNLYYYIVGMLMHDDYLNSEYRIYEDSVDEDHCFEFFCISKYWQHDDMSEIIIDFVRKNFNFQLLAKVILKYDFDDFDDIVKDFIVNNQKKMNDLENIKVFCKQLNEKNLEKFLVFISQIKNCFSYQILKFLLTKALKIESEGELWNLEKWVEVLKWFDFDSYDYSEQFELMKLIFVYLKPSSKEQRNEITSIILTRVYDDFNHKDIDDDYQKRKKKIAAKNQRKENVTDIAEFSKSFKNYDSVDCETIIKDDLVRFKLNLPNEFRFGNCKDGFYLSSIDVSSFSITTISYDKKAKMPKSSLNVGWAIDVRPDMPGWENFVYLEFEDTCIKDTLNKSPPFSVNKNKKIKVHYNVVTDNHGIVDGHWKGEDYAPFSSLSSKYIFEKIQCDHGILFRITNGDNPNSDFPFTLFVEDNKVDSSEWRMFIESGETKKDKIIVSLG